MQFRKVIARVLPLVVSERLFPDSYECISRCAWWNSLRFAGQLNCSTMSVFEGRWLSLKVLTFTGRINVVHPEGSKSHTDKILISTALINAISERFIGSSQTQSSADHKAVSSESELIPPIHGWLLSVSPKFVKHEIAKCFSFERNELNQLNFTASLCTPPANIPFPVKYPSVALPCHLLCPSQPCSPWFIDYINIKPQLSSAWSLCGRITVKRKNLVGMNASTRSSRSVCGLRRTFTRCEENQYIRLTLHAPRSPRRVDASLGDPINIRITHTSGLASETPFDGTWNRISIVKKNNVFWCAYQWHAIFYSVTICDKAFFPQWQLARFIFHKSKYRLCSNCSIFQQFLV